MDLKKTLEDLYPDSNLNIKSVEHGNFIKVTADGKTLYYLIDNNLLYAFQPPMTYFDTKSTHYQKFKSLFKILYRKNYYFINSYVFNRYFICQSKYFKWSWAFV